MQGLIKIKGNFEEKIGDIKSSIKILMSLTKTLNDAKNLIKKDEENAFKQRNCENGLPAPLTSSLAES